MKCKLIGKIRRRLYVNTAVLVYLHEKDTAATSPVTIVKADENSISDVLAFDSADYLPVYKRFFEEGQNCYLAYLDNRCVHRSWVIDKPQNVHTHWSHSMPLKENEVFIHYCLTDPIARGKNIFAYVLSEICREYKEYKALIAVEWNNKASIRSIEKAGFVPYIQIKVLIIAGIVIRKKAQNI